MLNKEGNPLKKLSEKEKKLNKDYSKVRARVEHVFA